MVNRFQYKHGLNTCIAVGARLAAKARLVLVYPGLDGILIEPECNTSTIGESFVIVFPVTDAVKLFFLSHKLNITALPHPRYLCSNAPCSLSNCGSYRIGLQ